MRLALMGGFAQTGFNMLLYVLLVRALPVADMRSWVMYMTLTAFADMARHGLVYNGTIRRLTQPEASHSETQTAALLLSLVVSGALALLFWATSGLLAEVFSAPLLPALSAAYLAYAPIWAVLKWLEMVHIARQNFAVSFWSAVTYGLFTCGVVGVLWFTGHTVLTPAVVALQTLAVMLAFGLCFLLFRLPIGLSLRWKSAFLELFHFGKYSAGTTTFSALFTKADVLLISALLPGAAVVLYDAAARVYTVLDIPMNSASQVYYPQLTAALHRKDSRETVAIFAKSVAQLLLLMVPLALVGMLFAKPLIALLAGAQYTEAAILLQILCIGTFIKPHGRMGGIMLDAMGLPAANFLKLILSALITAALNYIGIKLFGLTGAAIASAVAVWVTILGAQSWIHSRIPISHAAVWQHMLGYAQSATATLRLRNT